MEKKKIFKWIGLGLLIILGVMGSWSYIQLNISYRNIEKSYEILQALLTYQTEEAKKYGLIDKVLDHRPEPEEEKDS